MFIKPSEIFYSQDSINNIFDRRGIYGNKSIGSTLDDLVEGRCDLTDIPQMNVCYKNAKWFTLENRTLWVLKKLESLNIITHIDVNPYGKMPDGKYTTKNGGISVTVRGDPGGRWHLENDLSDGDYYDDGKYFGDDDGEYYDEGEYYGDGEDEYYDGCACGDEYYVDGDAEYYVDGEGEYYVDGEVEYYDDGEGEYYDGCTCGDEYYVDGDAEYYVDGEGEYYVDGECEYYDGCACGDEYYVDGDAEYYVDGEGEYYDGHGDGYYVDGNAEYYVDGDGEYYVDGDGEYYADDGGEYHDDGEYDSGCKAGSDDASVDEDDGVYYNPSDSEDDQDAEDLSESENHDDGDNNDYDDDDDDDDDPF